MKWHRRESSITSFQFLLLSFHTRRGVTAACGPGEIYDYPVKGCICVRPGNLIRCPVPPKQQCLQDFRLDECNMCSCDASKKSFSCTLNWCSWARYTKTHTSVMFPENIYDADAAEQIKFDSISSQAHATIIASRYLACSSVSIQISWQFQSIQTWTLSECSRLFWSWLPQFVWRPAEDKFTVATSSCSRKCCGWFAGITLASGLINVLEFNF